MAKTFQEILRDAGVAEDKLTALVNDPTLASALTNMVATAEQTLEQAQRKERDVRDFWDNKATPQINQVYSDNTALAAERDFYRTQAEKAKETGFIPKEAPSFTKVESGHNEVPGSPGFDPKKLDQVATDVQSAFFIAQSLSNNYLDLMGKPYVDLQTDLAEARAQGLKLDQYAERKYNFAGKRAERIEAQRKAEEDKFRKDEREKVTKEFQEKFGSNPDTRIPVTSNFSKFKKGEGGSMDRLAWSKGDRKDKHEALKQEALKELIH